MKKIISLLLALVLVISIFPCGTYATETEESSAATDGATEPSEGTEPVEESEPAAETEPDYGTTTFVYIGDNSSVTGANLKFWIKWGTAVYDKLAEQCGATISASGNSASLTIDRNTMTDTTVTINAWVTSPSLSWNGIPCKFNGDVYYLTDTGFTTDPSGAETPKTDYNFTVHCYGEGYQIGAWMALVEGGTETDWTDAGQSKTASFGTAQDGWSTASLSWSLEKTFNRLSFQIGTSSPWESSKYNYDFSGTGGEIWIIPGSTAIYTSLAAAEEALGDPEDPTEPVQTNQYQLTLHCYGEGYQVGAWMALVEDGAEVNWTPEDPNKTAAFSGLQDGWTSASLSWSVTDTFNRFGFQIGTDDPWTGDRYTYDFTGSSAELWIIPGDPRVFTSLEAAEEGLQNGYEATYSFTVHVKGEGYQVGAWLERIEGGKSVAWTTEDESIVAELENPEDGWTSVTLSWYSTESYNTLGLKLGKNDPWKGTQYTYKFKNPTGEEVWIVPGYSGAYATKKAALANAWKYYYCFDIHFYGEGYQVGSWLAKVENGEETNWSSNDSNVIRYFGDPQDGWTTATVAWSTKNVYNRLGFQIDKESAWDGMKYSYDFTERIGEVWILPDDPTVYLSAEDALEALNNPASAKYSFHIHCYGENYKIGAWMAQVANGTELAWTAETDSRLKEFTPGEDGWSDVWITWNLAEAYNRLGFSVSTGDPWMGAAYKVDFSQCPAEIWIIPGDMTVYASREEAEYILNPPTEPETEPVQTETPATESVVEESEEAGGGFVGVIALISLLIAFLVWLILFLRKRKIK